MATNVLTPSFSHTYAGKELLKPLFYAPQVEGKNPFDNYQVLPDVKTKVNIYIPNALSKVLREDSGCGFSAAGTTTITDKTITPTNVKVNVEICSEEFNQQIFAETYRAGNDRKDIQGTLIDQVIKNLLVGAMGHDIPSIVWWGDAADADLFFGIMDGFVEVFQDAAATIGDEITMTGTFVTAGVYDADGALGVLRQMYSDQSATLRAVPRTEKKLYVTPTTVDNLLTSYENTGTDSGLARLAEGVSKLSFRGIEIIEMSDWAVDLADAANPQAGAIGNNMIVLTPPQNLVIASDVSQEQVAKSWYDENEELVKFKINMKLGANIVHDELVSWAHD